jgi:hypothetical protein
VAREIMKDLCRNTNVVYSGILSLRKFLTPRDRWIECIWRSERMFPEEKFGSLEMPGEISHIPEEEDTTDAPTIIIPREYRKADPEEEFFWPF